MTTIIVIITIVIITIVLLLLQMRYHPVMMKWEEPYVCYYADVYNYVSLFTIACCDVFQLECQNNHLIGSHGRHRYSSLVL